jgi:hypothetical protein
VVQVLHKVAKQLNLDDNTIETMIDVFDTDLEGNPNELKYLLASRNWCQVSFNGNNLVFSINVEKITGNLEGETKSYTVTVPPLVL